MRPARLRAFVAGGGLATLAAVSAFALTGGSTPATAADRDAGDRAAALATAGGPEVFGGARIYARGGEARQRAAERAGAVPLPEGQSFDDIDWNTGELTDPMIEGLLEFNAACRWWMADADSPTKETQRVLASIPSWPSMRGGDRHDAALAFVTAPDGELAKQVLAYCRHESGR